jgi:hypothetical protein
MTSASGPSSGNSSPGGNSSSSPSSGNGPWSGSSRGSGGRSRTSGSSIGPRTSNCSRCASSCNRGFSFASKVWLKLICSRF